MFTMQLSKFQTGQGATKHLPITQNIVLIVQLLKNAVIEMFFAGLEALLPLCIWLNSKKSRKTSAGWLQM